MLGKRLKVKVDKRKILFDAEFAITHKVGHPDVIAAVGIKILALHKALK
jgi:hypothetical protein